MKRRVFLSIILLVASFISQQIIAQKVMDESAKCDVSNLNSCQIIGQPASTGALIVTSEVSE